MVFFVEKSLIVIIFMYAAGFGLLGVQYVLGDVMGITLKTFDNKPIKSNLLSVTLPILNITKINTVELNATSPVRSTVVNNPIASAASVLWELLLVLTGTYVFQMLYLLGVPAIIVSGLAVIYVILLMRTMIGYLRGI